MTSASRIATQEISENELDTVAGGVGGAAGLTIAGGVGGLVPVNFNVSAQGNVDASVLNSLTGLVPAI